MSKLTDYTRYADAQAHCSSSSLWRLFDGNREHLNIAYECLDRHVEAESPALIIVGSDGSDSVLSYRELSEDAARFAHFIAARGIGPGDRVAIMLEPTRAFYAALFGSMKRGAIAVPLFTLFGPDRLQLRIDDCSPRMLVISPDKANIAMPTDGLDIVVVDDDPSALLADYPVVYASSTRADDYAVYQYTSGTTRELPQAVKHAHRAIVTVMIAALYGTGLRPGDRFMCPSSPAWGHGLWHGTIAPLALGLTVGAYSGKFDPDRLLNALARHAFNNMSAAATHYRMMRNCGTADRYRYCLDKVSFTGEPIDEDAADFVEQTFGRAPCSMYGTTEVGVILASYPGAADFPVRRGSLGKPVPGCKVEVHDSNGNRVGPGVTGELMVWRRDGWIATKDLGYVDADGYFFHAGRADDVIISAGWTMSAVEIENAILQHPDVVETAVIGIADELRGQAVKAFVVSDRRDDMNLIEEVQTLVRTRLSQHEYPRHVEVVAELPKTPAGKVHRKILREREAAAARLGRGTASE